MIRIFAMDERGQSYPIVAISALLIFALLTATLGIGWLAQRRGELQAAADSAALAGANALAKAEMTISSLDLTQFMAHLAADVLIAVGGFVSYFGGAGAPILAKGLELKVNVETNLDPKIDKAKDWIRLVAPIYAVGNAVTYASANGCSGFAIPWPVDGLDGVLSGGYGQGTSDYLERMRELEKKLTDYNRRIEDADRKMAELKERFPDTYREVDLDNDGHPDFDQASGSKGGSTTWKRKTEEEVRKLAEEQRKAREEEKEKLLEKLSKMSAGKNGVIAIVWRSSERVPYVSLLGGGTTGLNVAIAGAKTVRGKGTIGSTAVQELISKSPLLGKALGYSLGNMIDGVGWLYNTKSGLQWPIGPAVDKALSALGLIPPDVFERRPVLTRSAKVLDIDNLKTLPAIIESVEKRAGELGIDIPDGDR